MLLGTIRPSISIISILLGPGLYRGGRETRKRPAKTIARERKEPK